MWACLLAGKLYPGFIILTLFLATITDKAVTFTNIIYKYH